MTFEVTPIILMHNVSMGSGTPARGSSHPWRPWSVCLVLVGAGLILLAAHQVFRPELGVSSPVFSLMERTCTARFHVTNHTGQPVTAILQVFVGHGWSGSDGHPPGYLEFGPQSDPWAAGTLGGARPRLRLAA